MIKRFTRTYRLSYGARNARDRRTSSTTSKYPPNLIYKRANSRRTFSWPFGWPARFSDCSSTCPGRLWTLQGRRDLRRGRNSLRVELMTRFVVKLSKKQKLLKHNIYPLLKLKNRFNRFSFLFRI